MGLRITELPARMRAFVMEIPGLLNSAGLDHAGVNSALSVAALQAKFTGTKQ